MADSKENGTKDPFELAGIDRDSVATSSNGDPEPISFSELQEAGKRSGPFDLSMPAFPTGRKTLGKYDTGLYPGRSQVKVRAKNQSNFNKLAKTIGNIPFNIGLGVIDMAGVGAEIVDYGLSEISGEDYDVDFTNAMTEFAEKNKDPLGEAFQYNPEAVTDFRDPAWYMNTGSALIESVASFLIAGGGIGAGALKTTSYIANQIGKGLKAGRLARGVQTTGQLVGQGFTSASLGMFEGGMAGRETFKEVYNAEYQKTGDVVAARKKASEIAASVAAESTAAVTALSMSSFYPIFQTARVLDKAGTFGLTRGIRESARKFASRMAKARTNPSAPTRGFYEKFGIPLEAGEEALQEVSNLWASERGRQKAGISDYDAEGLELFSEVFMSEEGLLSAALGGLGGTLQTVGMMRIPFHRRNMAKDGEKPDMQWKSAKDLAELQRSNAGVPYAKALEEDIRDVIQYQSDLEQAVADGDPAKIKLARERLYNVSAKRSIPVDGGNALKASLAELDAVDNTQNLYEVYSQELERAQQEGNQEMVQGLTTEIERLQETFPEQDVVTEAMSLGMADSPKDNQYKNTIKEKLAEVDEIRDLYEGIIAKYNYGDEMALGLAEYVFDLEMRKRVGKEEMAYLNENLGKLEAEIREVSDSILPEDISSDDVTKTAISIMQEKKNALQENIEEFKKAKEKAKKGAPQLRKEYGAQTNEELKSVLDRHIKENEKAINELDAKVSSRLGELIGEHTNTITNREQYKRFLKQKDKTSKILSTINERLSTIDSTKGRQEFVDKAYELYKKEEEAVKNVNEEADKREAAAKEKDDIDSAKETKTKETSDTPGSRIEVDEDTDSSPTAITKEDKEEVDSITTNENPPTERPENPTGTSSQLFGLIKGIVDTKEKSLGFDKKTVHSNKINWGFIRRYELFRSEKGRISKKTVSATRETPEALENFPELESGRNVMVGKKISLSVDREYDDLVKNKQNEDVQPDFNDPDNVPIKVELDGKLLGYLPSMDWLTQKDETGEYINIADFPLEGGITNAQFEINRLRDIRKSIFNEGPKTTTITKQSIGNPIYNYVEVEGEPARRVSKKATTALPDPDIEFGVVSQGMVSFPSDVISTRAKEGTVMALLAGVEVPMWIDPISKNQAELIERAILSTVDTPQSEGDRQAIIEAAKDLKIGFDFDTPAGLAKLVQPMVYTSTFTPKDLTNSSNPERVFFHVDDRSSAIYIGKAKDGVIYTSNQKLAEGDNPVYKNLFISETQLAPAAKEYLRELTSSIDKKKLNKDEPYEAIALKSDGTFGIESYDSYNEYVKTRLSTYIDGTNTINHGTEDNPDIEYLYFEQKVTLFNDLELLQHAKKKPARYEAPTEEDTKKDKKSKESKEDKKAKESAADKLRSRIAEKEAELYEAQSNIFKKGAKKKVNKLASEIEQLRQELLSLYQEESENSFPSERESEELSIEMPPYEVDRNLSMKDGSKVYGTSRGTTITINPVTKGEEQQFFDYMQGKVDSPTSKQKKKVLSELASKGYPLSRIKAILNTPKKINAFLVLHEQSHIENNDASTYYSTGKDLLSPNKIAIELRASIDALQKLEGTYESPEESGPTVTESQTDDGEMPWFDDQGVPFPTEDKQQEPYSSQGYNESPPPRDFEIRIPGQDPEVIIDRTKDVDQEKETAKDESTESEEIQGLLNQIEEQREKLEQDIEEIRKLGSKEELGSELESLIKEEHVGRVNWQLAVDMATNFKRDAEEFFNNPSRAIELLDSLSYLMDTSFQGVTYDTKEEYITAVRKKNIEDLKKEIETERKVSTSSGERFETEFGNVTITEDGTMYYDNGNEVTEDRVKNKVLVKKESKDGTLRYATYNGSEYAILSDGRIISQGKTTSGKEVYKEGNQRQQILESIGKTKDKIRPSQELTQETDTAATEQSSNYTIGDMVLNDEQQEAVDKMLDYLESPGDSDWFNLIGKAGTGKTTIAQVVARKYKKKYPNQRITVAAPTNKALKVIESKFKGTGLAKEFATVASLLGLRENKDGDFVPDMDAFAKIQNADVIFIDESSMVTEYMLAGLTGHNKKIIFMGDAGQLPPIRTGKWYEDKKELIDNDSPVFDEIGATAELKTRVRQGEESPILPYADYFWENSRKENPKPDPAPRTKGVKGTKGALLFANNTSDIQETIFDAFKHAIDNENPNYIKIVTYRNNTRHRTNKAVHNKMFGSDSSKYEKGEILIFNSSYSDPESTGVYNGTEGIVTRVEQPKEIKDTHWATSDDSTLEAYWVTVKDAFGQEVESPILTDKGRKTYKSNINKLWERAKSLKGTSSYKEAIKRAVSYQNYYPDVDYGYAITSHKSQGSTYDNVVVHADDILSVSPTTSKSKSQSIYTGLTRAKNVAIVVKKDSISTPDIDIVPLSSEIDSNKQGAIVEDIENASEQFTEPNHSEKPTIDDIIGEDTASGRSDSSTEYRQMAHFEDSGVGEFKNKHSIDGFDEQQVFDVVQVITHIVAKVIEKNPDVSVDQTFTIAYEAFQSQKSKHQRDENMLLQARFDSILNKWDQFQQRALLSLKSIGYEVSDTKFEGENSDYERRRYDDRAKWTQSNKDTASSNLKLFMSHLPQEEFIYDEEGNKSTVKYKSDFTGLPRYVSLDETFDKLLAVLVNETASIDNFMSLIEQAGQDFAPFITLHKKLSNLPETSTIKDELIKAMSNQYLDLVLALFEVKKDRNNNIVDMVFKPIHSDRNSAIDMIFKGWVENFKSSDLVKTEDAKLVVDGDKVEALKEKLIEDLSDKEFFYQKAGAVREFLEGLGLDLHESTWERILDGNSEIFEEGKTINSQFRIVDGAPVPNTKLALLFENLKAGDIETSAPLTTGKLHKMFKRLASVEYKNSPKLYSSSFLDVNGNSINPYQMHSLLSDSLLKLAEDDQFVETLQQFSFNSKAWWLQEENRGEVSVEYLDGIKNQTTKRGNDAVSSGRSDLDLLSAVLYFGTVGQTGGKKGRMLTTTKADKTQYPVINAPRVAIEPNFEGGKLVGLLGHDRKQIKNLIEAEFARVRNFVRNKKAFDESSLDLGSYKEGASKFILFPELNPEFAKSYVSQGVITQKEYNKVWGSGETYYNLSDTETTSSVKIMYKIVEYNLMQQKDGLIDDWNRAGLIGSRETTIVSSKGKETQVDINSLIDKSYLKHHTTGARSTEAKIEVAAVDFLVNHMISMANEFMVVSGDPAAFWKGSPENSLMQNINATRENINKRLARDIAPRSKGDYESPEFTMAVLKDPEVYSKEVKKISDDFGLMEIADAQEYTTVQEHLRNMKADGQLSPAEFKRLSDKIKPGKYYEFTEQEMATIFTPLKPIYTGHRSLVSHDVHLPIYVKSSSFPLLPQMLQEFQLDKLRQQMEAPSEGPPVDRASYVTANKVGVTNVAEIFEGRELKSSISLASAAFKLPREGFGLQQDVPVKDKTTINVVSQANKLLFSGLREIEGFKFEGSDYTGRELEVVKEGIRSSLLKQAETEMYNKLGISVTGSGDLQINSLKKIQNVLKEQALELGWNVAALDAIELTEDKQSFKIPLSLSPNAGAIESLLLAQISNITLKQEMKGYSYVQGSSAGFKTLTEYQAMEAPGFVPTDEFDGELHYMKETDDGITPAGIMVPWNFRDSQGQLLDINQFKKADGTIDSEKLPPSVRKMIGFRIPNQGHNSMIPLQIVGFLPPNSTLAIVPEEIVAQMGSDFDVDKLYTYQPQTTYDKDVGFRRLENTLDQYEAPERGSLSDHQVKRKGQRHREDLVEVESKAPYYHVPTDVLQDKYFEIFESVLTHPDVFDKIRSSLDKKDMEQEKQEINYRRGRGSELSSPINFRQQRDYALNQKGAQTFVGIAALANVFNTTIEDKKKADLRLTKPGKEEAVPYSIQVKIDGKPVSLTTLSGEGHSAYKGESRTSGDNISILLSEAVDNANNNNLGATNYKVPIASSIIAMLMAKTDDGQALDIGYVSKFINQPVIDSIIERVESFSSALSESYGEDIYSAIAQERKEVYKYKEKGSFKKEALGVEDLVDTIGTSFDQMTEKQLDIQLGVLSMLTDFAKIGDDIRKLQSYLLSPATKGMDNRVINSIRNELEMKKFFADGSGYIANIEELLTNVNGDPSEQAVAMDVIYNNGKKLIDRLMPEYERYLYSAMEDIGYLTGRNLSNQQIDTIWKGIKSYFNSRVDLMNVSESAQSIRERLLFGTESQSDLASRIEQAQQTWGRDHYFLNRLVTVKSTRPGVTPNKIEFRADKTVRTDDFMNTITFSGLLSSGDPVKRNLGKDLVLYDLLTGGVQGATQYSKYIPPTYLQYLGISKVYSHIDKLPANALMEILQHNPSLAYSIPEDLIIDTEEAPRGEFNNKNRKPVDYIHLKEPKEESSITMPPNKQGVINYKKFLSYYNEQTKRLELYIKEPRESDTGSFAVFRRVERKGINQISEYGSDKSLLREKEQFPKAPASTTPATKNEAAPKDYSESFTPDAAWGFFVDLHKTFGFKKQSSSMSLLEGQTVHDVFSREDMRDVVEEDSLPLYDLLLRALEGRDIKVILNNNKNASYKAEVIIRTSDAGVSEELVLATGNINSAKEFTEVLLHEFTHLAVQNSLEGSSDAAKSLQTLFSKVKRQIKSDHPAVNEALTNIHEFVSYGMSNTEVQKELNNHTFDGNQTMLDRLKAIIASILQEIKKRLGVDVEQDSALNELINRTVELITEQSNDAPPSRPPSGIITRQLADFNDSNDIPEGISFGSYIAGESEAIPEGVSFEDYVKSGAISDPNIVTPKEKAINVIESRLSGVYETIKKTPIGDPKREQLQKVLDNLREEKDILEVEDLKDSILKVAKSQAAWVTEISKNTSNDFSLLNIARKTANNWNWETTQQFLTSSEKEAKEGDPGYEVKEAFVEASKLMEFAKFDVDRALAMKFVDNINNGLPRDYQIDLDDLSSMKDIGITGSFLFDLSQADNQLASYMFDKMTRVHKAAENEFQAIEKEINKHINKLSKEEWEDFKQLDEEGNWTKNFIHEYSYKYTKELELIDKKLRKELAKAFKEGKGTTSESRSAALEEYHRSINKIQETIDLRMIVDDGVSTPLWNSKEEYMDYLEKEFGENKAKQLVEEALYNYEEYKAKRKEQREFLEIQSPRLSEGYTKEQWVEDRMEEWESEHDPMKYMDEKFGILEGKISDYTASKAKKYAVSVPRKTDKNGKDLGYYDENFKNLNKNQKEFYNFYINLIHRLKSNLPSDIKNNVQENFFPQVKKRFIEEMTSNGLQAALGLANENLTKSITAGTVKELNEKHGAFGREIDPETGLPIKEIEVLFTDTDVDAKDLSFDIAGNLRMFANTAINYKWKSQIEDEMHIGLNIIKQADRIQTSGETPLIDKYKNLIVDKEGVPRLSEATEYAVDAMIYNKKREDMGELDMPIFESYNMFLNSRKRRRMREIENERDALEDRFDDNKVSEDEYNSLMDKLEKEYRGEIAAKIEDNDQYIKQLKQLENRKESLSPEEYATQKKEIKDKIITLEGRNLVLSKLGDRFLEYTQLKGMGWNLTAGIANIGFGMLSNIAWSGSKQDFSGRDLAKAYGLVLKSVLPGSSNKIQHLTKLYNVLFEVTEVEHGKSSDKDKRTNSKTYNFFADKLHPYAIQTKTEYFVQGMSLVAQMLHKKIKVKNAKTGKEEEISLFDAYNEEGEWNTTYEQPDTWKAPHKSSEGIDNTFNTFKAKVIQVNKYLHGNYDPGSPWLLKKTTIGRMVGQFRSWIPYGFKQRFGAKQYDRLLGREFKGRYRTLYDIGFIKSIKALIGTGVRADEFAFGKKGSKDRLSQIDIDNIKMNFRELLSLIALIGAQVALKTMLDDLEENSPESRTAHVLINQLYRVEQDVYFYLDPSTSIEILRNPVPLIQTYMDGQRIINDSIQYLTEDDFDGQRVVKNIQSATPFANQIVKTDYLSNHLH